MAEREGVLSELREWLLDGSESTGDGDFAFDDIIPIFVFDEAADVLFTVPSGEFRDKLLLWDHETGVPGEEVIANDLEAFVELVLGNPIPVLESDVRFTWRDVPDGTLSEDAQLIAVGIEETSDHRG